MERQSRSTMGMPAILEIVDGSATQEAYDAVFNYFDSIDERFSTYKDTSEVSRLNRHEISESEYSPELREVLALCAETIVGTNGYFDIHTPAGIIDPSGLVKGWAIERAAQMLRDKGFENFYVEIAGDVQTAGKNSMGEEWSIGIRNPFAEGEIVKVVYPHGAGVATSGTYLRGAHIYNPHDASGPSEDFVSLTVIGPNVYEADRFATAAFVMGTKGLEFIQALPGFAAYAITPDRQALMTSTFSNYTSL